MGFEICEGLLLAQIVDVHLIQFFDPLAIQLNPLTDYDFFPVYMKNYSFNNNHLFIKC